MQSISRWSINCRWHTSECTHNNAYSFINCHQTIIMIISKPFYDSKCCWYADKTNTNSCQAWILVNLTNVVPSHSSIQYRHNFSYHLIEETYSYPHIIWKFPENMLKYLYGGTFEKCKLFLIRTVLCWIIILRAASDWFKKCFCWQHAIFPGYYKSFADLCFGWYMPIFLWIRIPEDNLIKSYENW